MAISLITSFVFETGAWSAHLICTLILSLSNVGGKSALLRVSSSLGMAVLKAAHLRHSLDTITYIALVVLLFILLLSNMLLLAILSVVVPNYHLMGVAACFWHSSIVSFVSSFFAGPPVHELLRYYK